VALRVWLKASKVYLDRRLLVVMALGFSAGMPLLLVYGTLSAWLTESGVSFTVIGLFSWASTAYALKFLWAPLVDRVPIPVLSRLLGQRRSWLLLAQTVCAASMIAIGSTTPADDLMLTAIWAVVLACASATQDIVIDAYRIETLEEEEQGAGAATYQLGYRVALIAAGAGALIIADLGGWFYAYLAMAGLMGVGIVTTLISPEPPKQQRSPEEGGRSLARYGRWIEQAIVMPFKDFMTRPGWILILLFIMLYKYGDGLLGVMANPFYLDIGFTKTEIGLVSKTYGVAMTIIGGLVGGLLVVRVGIMRALFSAGIIMALSNLLFSALALIGPSVPALMLVISAENLANGIGGTAFIAYLSSLCSLAYTATQYALVSSFMNFARTIFASGGGWLADQVDWAIYFILTTIAAVPGLLLLLYIMKRYPNQTQAARDRTSLK